MSAQSNTEQNLESLNETGEREGEDRRTDDQPVAKERREVQRRRQIDPTTCERDYSDDEIEFMQALDVYKRASGRMFPTCSEILEVLIGMGYRRMFDADGLPIEPIASSTSAEPFYAQPSTTDEEDEDFDEESEE